MDKITYKKRIRYKYTLVKDYRFKTKLSEPKDIKKDSDFIELTTDGWLTIKKGYAWDGPSGPTIDTKNFMRGSLVHDALYQLMREKIIPIDRREYADKLLKDLCLEDGMSKLRAWYVHWAVDKYGEKNAHPESLRLVAP